MNVVVTGASRGIGRAIAVKFARLGHRVIVCSRDPEKLGALQAEHPDIRIKTCDLARRPEVEAFAGYVLETFGTVDVLVNNGGIFLPGRITEEADGQLERIMDTNLFSAYHLTRRLVPGMIERQSGYIVNLCSVASLYAYPNGGSYSISKFALHGFSKTLREELKPHGIKVTSVLPGATLTDSWSGSDLPASRFIPAEDIAELVYTISQLSGSTVVEELLVRPQLGDI